jgi:hypothetical protein
VTTTAEPGASIPLEGKLGDPAVLPRLYAWLSRGEWSGTVLVRSGDVERRVVFLEGRIHSATSNDPGESLEHLLVATGSVTPDDLARAGGAAGDRGAALGRQLVRTGHLSDRDLAAAERRRSIAVAEATVAARTGAYRAEAGATGAESAAQGLEVARVIATGVLKSWEDVWALEVLGGWDAVHDLSAERLADYECTGAEEAYDLTLLRLDGSRTLREAVGQSPLPEGAALRFLAACRLLGVIEPAMHRPLATPAGGHPAAPAAARPRREEPEPPRPVLRAAAGEPAPGLSASSQATPSAGAPAASGMTGPSDAAPSTPGEGLGTLVRRHGRWLIFVALLSGIAVLAWSLVRGWSELLGASGGAP